MKKRSGRLAILLLTAAMTVLPCMPVWAASLSYVMNAHKDEIITECRKYGIWPSLVVGMAGVESGTSSLSGLAEGYNNYWGHTYSPTIAAKIPGTGHVYGAFAAYPSFMDGVRAHLMWFWQNGYGGVQSVLRNLSSSPADCYYAVVSSGYMANTAGYASGIFNAAALVGADEWDYEAFPDGRKFIPYIPGLPCSQQIGEYDYPADEYNPYVQNVRLLTEGSGTEEKTGTANTGIVKLSAELPSAAGDEHAEAGDEINIKLPDQESESLSAVSR